ncbi:MAG: hypothetical protein WD749_12110 [Phycisphaerales bacterium]
MALSFAGPSAMLSATPSKRTITLGVPDGENSRSPVLRSVRANWPGRWIESCPRTSPTISVSCSPSPKR